MDPKIIIGNQYCWYMGRDKYLYLSDDVDDIYIKNKVLEPASNRKFKIDGPVFKKMTHVVHPFDRKNIIQINGPEYNYIYGKYDVAKNNHLINLLLNEKEDVKLEYRDHIDKLVTLLRKYNA